MVFASLLFLAIFLPINLIGYYLLRTTRLRNAWLILSSLVFYAWGEPIWITLLIFSTLIDYIHGLLVQRFRGQFLAKLFVVSCLFINLGLLATFKYGGFIVENVNFLLGTSFGAPSFSLPIGISFYTFQSISYVLDVYRGDHPAQRSYPKFLLFVSMYHQLVAGPIVRYSHIAAEIDNRLNTFKDFSSGVSRFCLGLFKKVAIANVAGELAHRFLDADLTSLSAGEAMFGLFAFSIQIYFDFSGYSDMAIGLGRMFGFHYHENFNHPYIAKSATEFWRRWHISLGTFFRDYVYIPMGGRKRRIYLNLFVVWFLTGLWHGASWNFVLWGVFYGLLISIEKAFLGKLLDRLPGIVGHLYLLTAVLFGWAIFYFVDIGRLGDFLGAIAGQNPGPLIGREVMVVISDHAIWLALAIVMCTPWPERVLRGLVGPEAGGRLAGIGDGLRIGFNALVLFICVAMLVGGTYNPFLYFRF
ncbi:MAG TPA: MBOAT family O-acyltransferase [Myxococcota bacterium]|nr:MBOAT family O-acyltransferase [Myxococcota bacterium]